MLTISYEAIVHFIKIYIVTLKMVDLINLLESKLQNEVSSNHMHLQTLNAKAVSFYCV